MPKLTDVNTDQQHKGLETDLVIDRDTAARLGITVSQIDNTLYDAFGQRQVSTIYSRAQPVSRRHGGGAALLAEPGDAEGHLRQHLRRLGQRHAGDQRGRRHGRASTSDASAASRRQSPQTPRAIQPTNSIGATGKGVGLDRRRGQHQRRRRWCRCRPSRTSSQGATPLAVNHQGLFVATTISFNLPPGVSLSDGDRRDRRAR